MIKRPVLIVLRLFFGLMTLTAIGRQFAIHLEHGFNVLNFFSYFTNLANLFAAVVLIASALLLLKQRDFSAVDGWIRGASVVNMSVVGIVFTILLRDVDLGHLLPWVNALLHYVMPVVVLLDWLYAPPGTIPGARQMLAWQVLAAIYLIYVLIRGSITGWYPYPFLDPTKVNGYGNVAGYILGVMATFLVTSRLLSAAVGCCRQQQEVIAKRTTRLVEILYNTSRRALSVFDQRSRYAKEQRGTQC